MDLEGVQYHRPHLIELESTHSVVRRDIAQRVSAYIATLDLPISSIMLFGSAQKHTAAATSDVDLCIIVDDIERIAEQVGDQVVTKCGEAGFSVGIRPLYLDLHFLSKEVLENPGFKLQNRQNVTFFESVRDGVVLFDKKRS